MRDLINNDGIFSSSSEGEVAVVVVAGTVVALVMGVKEKNDGRETRETTAYDAYCIVRCRGWTMCDSRDVGARRRGNHCII